MAPIVLLKRRQFPPALLQQVHHQMAPLSHVPRLALLSRTSFKWCHLKNDHGCGRSSIDGAPTYSSTPSDVTPSRQERRQVGPLTLHFHFQFSKNSLICLEVKSTTPITLVFQLEDTVRLFGTLLLLDPIHFPKSEPCLLIGSVCQNGALLGTSL